MRASPSALAVLLLPLVVSSRASADRIGSDGDAFVDEDTTGAPILVVGTPVLEPGKTYEFETYELSPLPGSSYADTVMSITEGALATYESLAGADACDSGVFEYQRSCFTFFVDPVQYGSGRVFYLWVRAWRTYTAGTTRIRYREVGAGTWTEITTGPRTYGGYIVENPGPNMAGWIEFQTTSLPGADIGCGDGGLCDQHVIRFTDANWDTTVNWYLAANYDWSLSGDPYTFDRASGGTADFLWAGSALDLPSGGAPSTVIAGTHYPIGAPFRLIRNTAVEGSDNDGDGIGLEVERILNTCDDRSQAGCDTLPHCDVSGPRCTASLRDSDGDGIRDDAELFGVDESVMPDGNHLPRYGADPARYDIFVELDNLGHPTGPGGACEPEKPELTEAELVSAYQVFGRVPVPNRVGDPGITAHFDVGYVPSSTLFDPIFGMRGGADDCLIVPDGSDQYTAGMQDHRRWIWRHMVLQTGSAMKLLRLSGAFRSPATLVHELGHSAGLSHYGPAGVRDQFNGKPNHVSRINYIYQDSGGGDLSGPSADLIAYSTGAYASQPIGPLWVDETVRYSASGRIDLLEDAGERFSGHFTYDPADDTYRIDFDRNGAESSYTEASVCGRDIHVQRATNVNKRDASDECIKETQTSRFAHRRGGDLAVAGDLMVWAKIELDEQSGDFSLRATVNHGMYCSAQDVPESDPLAAFWRDCADPFATPNGFPPCWDADWANPDPSIGLTHTDGSPIRPLAVAVEGWESGGLSTFVVVYVELEGAAAALRYGLLVPDGSPTGLAWYDKGAVPGAAALDAPLAVDGGARGVSLAGLGGWEELGYMLLTYRAATDEVVQQYLLVTDVDSVDWWPADPAIEDDGTPIVVDSGSVAAPGTVQVTGAYGDGVVLLSPEINPMTLYEQWSVFYRQAAAAQWTRMGRVISIAGVRGRPSVAQVPHPHGDRLVVVWQGGNDVAGENHILHYAETYYNDWAFQIEERFHGGYQAEMDPAMVYDARPSVYPPGLRLVYGQWVTCGTAGTACDEATTCTSIPGTGNKNFCDMDGWFGRVREILVPFADGVFPAILRDYDETSMVDYGFCRALRDCTWDMTTCIPPEYQDLDEYGGVLTREPCGDRPTYY